GRIASGNMLAMRLLYQRHSAPLYRFALGIVHDEGAAENIVCDVFFDVWCDAASFEHRSQVSTWLLAIARDRAVKALRSRSGEPLGGTGTALVEDIVAPPELTTGKSSIAAIVRDSIVQLSRFRREVIDAPRRWRRFRRIAMASTT